MDKTIVVNRHFESYDIYIGRGTKWGNPFKEGKDGTREEVIELYRQYAKNNPNIYNSLNELKGKRLGCSCKPLPCHGDILVEMVNNMKKYNKIVIGLDESYTRTGVGIAADGKLLMVKSTPFKGCKNKSEKRKHLANILNKLLTKASSEANLVIVICERIRTFTKGDKLRPNYLKSTGALIATIVDTAYEHGIEVYSVDTRSWKSKVVGTSKGGKMPTIKYIEKLGFDVSYENKKGELKYDDDAADAGGIALYGFIPEKQQNLKLEE